MKSSGAHSVKLTGRIFHHIVALPLSDFLEQDHL